MFEVRHLAVFRTVRRFGFFRICHDQSVPVLPGQGQSRGDASAGVESMLPIAGGFTLSLRRRVTRRCPGFCGPGGSWEPVETVARPVSRDALKGGCNVRWPRCKAGYFVARNQGKPAAVKKS